MKAGDPRTGRRLRLRRAAAAVILVLAPAAAEANGFFVNADGDFVSAYHLIGECAEPAVETSEMRLPAVRIAASATEDLVLIRTRGAPRGVFARFPASVGQSLAEPLRMVRRSGDGDEVRTVEASFLGRAEQLGGKMVFQTERSIRGGDSGSPIVDGLARVVGLVVAKATHRAFLAIAVEAGTIVDFLAEAGISIVTDDRRLGADDGKTAANAVGFTYPVTCLDSGGKRR
jgi:S1-C subfamily serine protease